MFPFIIFTLVFGAAAGATIDQTQPKVHDTVAKYIVGAAHDEPQPFEDKDNAHKR